MTQGHAWRALGTALAVLGGAGALVVTAASVVLWLADPCFPPNRCEGRPLVTAVAEVPSGLGLLVLGLGLFVRSWGRRHE